MFGFGKEKINFLNVVTIYEASCFTLRKYLDDVLQCIPEYKESSELEEDIELAVQSFAMGLMRFCLQGDEKDEFRLIAKSKQLADYISRDKKRFSKIEDYIDREYEITEILAEYSRGKPNLSFITGIIKIINVDESKIDNYAEEHEESFPLDVVKGALASHQEYLRNKKIVGDDMDKEAIDFVMNTLNKLDEDNFKFLDI